MNEKQSTGISFKRIFSRKILLYVLIYFTGLLIGIAVSDTVKDFTGFGIKEHSVRLTNPMLRYDVGREILEKNELKPFKYKLEYFIKSRLKSKAVDRISVYFRDLNNGPWFSIEPEEDFAPASLLKVPLMIALLKEAEMNPSMLKNKVKFESSIDHNAEQRTKPSRKLEFGEYYTVEDLIYRMIAYSDNNAYFLLESIVDTNILKKTYNDLGIINPYLIQKSNFMSVVSYSSFFRILFNASYLNEKMSEKALRYLAKAEYREGLVDGVAPNITVAHKFGEQTLIGSGKTTRELHDCGIIYYPKRPYLLCVMTKGSNFEYLDDTIRDISRFVYEEINRQQSD